MSSKKRGGGISDWLHSAASGGEDYIQILHFKLQLRGCAESLLLFDTGALEQGNKCADVAVVGGAKHSSSDTTIRYAYSLTGNIAKS
jgi:hypothetical protein